MSTSVRDSTIRNLAWKMFERTGYQLFTFLVQIILARLLAPNDIGILAIVNVFIELAIAFTQYGFKAALVRKKDLDNADITSVFYLSLIASIGIYILLYLVSSSIEAFFEIPGLGIILKILSINIITGAIISVLNAILENRLEFKKQFLCSITAVIPSGITAVIAAYAGFGIWSIVLQQVLYNLIYLFILQYIIKFKPSKKISLLKIRFLFSFGWKMLAIKLMDTLFAEIRTLIIGKNYSPSSLAYYDKGKQFPNLIIRNINASLQSVMLPVLANYQDDIGSLKNMVRKSIQLSSYVITPMLIGLAVISKPLLYILLTEKWNSSIIYLQIFCFVYALWPLDTTNQQLVTALGRSDILLIIELVKKCSDIIFLLITLNHGPIFIAIGTLGASIIATIIYMYPNYKLISYSYFEQIKDFSLNLIQSLIMGMLTYSISFFDFNYISLLIIQIIIGGLSYCFLSILFNNPSYYYLKKYVCESVNKRRG